MMTNTKQLLRGEHNARMMNGHEVTRVSYVGNIPRRGGDIVNIWFKDGPVVCQYARCVVREDGLAYFQMDGLWYSVRAQVYGGSEFKLVGDKLPA